jgi:GNAT superfamily N-acetyltransferase
VGSTRIRLVNDTLSSGYGDAFIDASTILLSADAGHYMFVLRNMVGVGIAKALLLEILQKMEADGIHDGVSQLVSSCSGQKKVMLRARCKRAILQK